MPKSKNIKLGDTEQNSNKRKSAPLRHKKTRRSEQSWKKQDGEKKKIEDPQKQKKNHSLERKSKEKKSVPGS